MRLDNGLWLFKDRLTINCGYYPTWEKPDYALWNNGGRKADECLTLNVNCWRFHFDMCLWNIGRWSRILKYWPSRYANTVDDR